MPNDSNKNRVITSDFVISNSDVSRCPNDKLPEYAFIGRSNVGKSSLINMLCGRKNLALTSSKPGKTLLINHFIINKSWYLVDLPGYGYAKRSKKITGKIGTIVERYINEREALTCLFVLVDSRIEPQQIDVDFINHAGAHNIPIAIVFTKADRKRQHRKDEKHAGPNVGRTSPHIRNIVSPQNRKRGAACVYRRNQCFAEILVSILYHITRVAA